MRPLHRCMVVLVGIVTAGGGWWHYRTPEVTVLSFHIGQTFEEVAKASTYPVMMHSNIPSEDDTQFGATWVSDPAVVIRFNDPKHGFVLPPTKFAALTYSHNKAATLATSPMLEKMPFDQAVTVLENLQEQFKAGGWEPWEGDDSKWFDLTPEGKRRLYEAMVQTGVSQTLELRIPKKYGMTFRFWCAAGCGTRKPPYLFMIDVGIGRDTHSWWDEDRRRGAGGD